MSTTTVYVPKYVPKLGYTPTNAVLPKPAQRALNRLRIVEVSISYTLGVNSGHYKALARNESDGVNDRELEATIKFTRKLERINILTKQLLKTCVLPTTNLPFWFHVVCSAEGNFDRVMWYSQHGKKLPGITQELYDKHIIGFADSIDMVEIALEGMSEYIE